MDTETQKKVEATVLEILRGSDLESITEHKVRSAAASRLGIDLSPTDRKLFVRRVVEDYLQSLSQEDGQQQGGAGEGDKGKQVEAEVEEEEEEEGEEEDEEEEKKSSGGKWEYDDAGDLILCRLSTKRRVTLQEFRGRTLVSIREYYYKDGKELPAKGISLTVEQWDAFRNSVPAVEDAIKKLEESD